MAESNCKAFVLLSGGLDSTTCLHRAIYDYGRMCGDADEDIRRRVWNNFDHFNNGGEECPDPISWVEAVSCDYGQRHKKETDYAHKMCAVHGIKHTILNLGTLLADENTMLTNPNINIPDVSYSALPEGVSPTYVPFRNGLMLSAITAHVQKWVNVQNEEYRHMIEKVRAGIYFGAHAEDAANWAYPDCTPEFIGAMANAIFIGSYQQIRLHTPLMSMMKCEIVELGQKMEVPWELTWSCYKGEDLHCGTCPTCRSRREAFALANVNDPTLYADVPYNYDQPDDQPDNSWLPF